MKTETDIQIQTSHVDIEPGIEGNIDIMANSCAQAFLLRDDGRSTTDEMRVEVYEHFVLGIQTLTGLEKSQAEALARQKLSLALSRHPVDQTIFSTVPDVTTGEITALQNSYYAEIEPRPVVGRVKRLFLRASALVKLS